MPADTRKVSATIPAEQHVQLKQLAAQHGTTIESLVGLGIKLAVRKLKSDQGAAKTLAPDHRLSR